MASSESLSCPRCGAGMTTRPIGSAHEGGEVAQCPDGHGVFLSRADLGALVEAEVEWHRHAGQHTTPMPRITPEMTAPPTGRVAPRAWVETLFG
jgi:uncharacterized protein